MKIEVKNVTSSFYNNKTKEIKTVKSEVSIEDRRLCFESTEVKKETTTQIKTNEQNTTKKTNAIKTNTANKTNQANAATTAKKAQSSK